MIFSVLRYRKGGILVRNIPIFTTEAGVASLILEEIPYKKCAYVRIQSSLSPKQLLDDCVAFCRAAGAAYIYATGSEFLDRYPVFAELWEMSCRRDQLECGNAERIPVDQNNLEAWCAIYNQRMADVPKAATMTPAAAKKLLDTADAYFVYLDNVCIGIGKAKGDRVEAIATCVSGRGSEVLLALCGALSCEYIKVQVASSNIPAIKLYEKYGFIKTGTISCWYTVAG